MSSPYILVVDDDDDIRETLSEALELAGYAVKTAPHGGEALSLLAEGEKPCLIVLDLMMPVMDGYAFREEQLRRPELASIPVVMVTASRSVREASTGAATVLFKPFSLGRLMAAVEQHC